MLIISHVTYAIQKSAVKLLSLYFKAAILKMCFLDQQYSIIWKLARATNSQVHGRPTESKTLEVAQQSLFQ